MLSKTTFKRVMGSLMLFGAPVSAWVISGEYAGDYFGLGQIKNVNWFFTIRDGQVPGDMLDLS